MSCQWLFSSCCCCNSLETFQVNCHSLSERTSTKGKMESHRMNPCGWMTRGIWRSKNKVSNLTHTHIILPAWSKKKYLILPYSVSMQGFFYQRDQLQCGKMPLRCRLRNVHFIRFLIPCQFATLVNSPESPSCLALHSFATTLAIILIDLIKMYSGK